MRVHGNCLLENVQNSYISVLNGTVDIVRGLLFTIIKETGLFGKLMNKISRRVGRKMKCDAKTFVLNNLQLFPEFAVGNHKNWRCIGKN